MKEIAPDILIETEYEGVTLGAIRSDAGVVMVDVPINPKDTLAWRATCSRSAGGSDRLLVLLDEHPDRLAGASGVKCPIIVSDRTAQALTYRPTGARPLSPQANQDWEEIPEPVNTRGIHPELTFTSSMAINWGEDSIMLEHHPGPSKGSTWLIVPEKQVAFLGDTVTPGQAPFLANAEIDAWLESLHELQLSRFKDFILISGRGEMATIDDVRELERFLKKAARKLEKMTPSDTNSDEIDKIAGELADEFKTRTKRETEQIKGKLAAGIVQYIANRPSKKTE